MCGVSKSHWVTAYPWHVQQWTYGFITMTFLHFSRNLWVIFLFGTKWFLSSCPEFKPGLAALSSSKFMLINNLPFLRRMKTLNTSTKLQRKETCNQQRNVYRLDAVLLFTLKKSRFQIFNRRTRSTEKNIHDDIRSFISLLRQLAQRSGRGWHMWQADEWGTGDDT